MAKTFDEHIEMARAAWDAHHPSWMEGLRKKHPGREQGLARGQVYLDADQVRVLGDITDQRVLALACGPDAVQAFSLANLGARVTGCDLSPVAIEIAKKNAEKTGLDVEFAAADSQVLAGIPDGGFDLVYSHGCFIFYEDLPRAFRTWYRVLRPGGRVFIKEDHFVSRLLEETDGAIKATRSYHDKTPEYFTTGPSDLPDVEFSHTLAETINAMVAAGFILEYMEEPCSRESYQTMPEQLPSHVLMVARKPVGAEGVNKPMDRDR
jgi:SAM-dependent methyltransferase